MRKGFDKLRGRGGKAVAGAAGVLLTIAGCGGSSSDPAEVRFRFNDLDGGSPYIQVYPGVGESAADKKSNGTYRNGDERRVLCHTLGRTVTSHPEVGEELRSLPDWYKLAGGTVVQFATGTYGDIVPQGAVVPECP